MMEITILRPPTICLRTGSATVRSPETETEYIWGSEESAEPLAIRWLAEQSTTTDEGSHRRWDVRLPGDGWLDDSAIASLIGDCSRRRAAAFARMTGDRLLEAETSTRTGTTNNAVPIDIREGIA